MPQLQFTRDLVAPIRSGRKTQTLRARLPSGCIVGSRLTLLNGYHVAAFLGHATIVAIDCIRKIDLTHDDAVHDGFATLADLHDRLVAMHAPDMLWRIRWRDFIPAPVIARPVDAPSKTRRIQRPHKDGRHRRHLVSESSSR